MKKFLILLMTLCVLVCALCITASAEEEATSEPAPGTVMRVRALTKKNDLTVLGDYTVFEDGWNYAMDQANSRAYARIVVDIYTDWTANAGGNFTTDKPWEKNGPGFNADTIFIPSNARVTLNLNGHTIDRAMPSWDYNGEVIHIYDDADVIINDGTITGGWSCNGAGGIHMQDDSKLTLNNVHIIKNKTEDDDGGGIAVYDGAELTMKGGSISDNEAIRSTVSQVFGAGVYVEDSTASFTDVTFKNNHSNGNPEYSRDQYGNYNAYGAAIYSYNSTVTIDSCKFYENGTKYGNFINTKSVISVVSDSYMTLKNTIFERNGEGQRISNAQSSTYLDTNFFLTFDSSLTFESCEFYNNYTGVLLDMDNKTTLIANNTIFKHNASAVYCGEILNDGNSAFTNCTFDKNTNYPYIFEFSTKGNPTFVDCDMGNSSFNDRSRAKFVDTDAQNGTGSIFGEGSLSMIVSLLSLAASVVAICLIFMNKKKATPAAAVAPCAVGESQTKNTQSDEE